MRNRTRIVAALLITGTLLVGTGIRAYADIYFIKCTVVDVPCPLTISLNIFGGQCCLNAGTYTFGNPPNATLNDTANTVNPPQCGYVTFSRGFICNWLSDQFCGGAQPDFDGLCN
jgi:hypothetical protein